MFKYRPEIDGLRAIAVLPVILFHAGNSLFPGGFLGVDVFFAISGYLITSIIISEQHKGIFSLVRFYSRRAKRILPPLFVMLAAVGIVASFFPGSDMALDTLRAFSHITTFTANIYFYNQGGYFDTATELKPLFHTWSLSVEEQFYVFFPLLLIATKNIRKHHLLLILSALFLVSLIAAQYLVAIAPSWSYYMLPTRAWELMAGAMAAIFLFNNEDFKIHPPVAEALSFLGLLLIVAPLFWFGPQTPHPSFFTLIPIVGTVLILVSGASAPGIQKFLGAPVAVGIGLISYSLYLWHQPLFALYKLHVELHIPLLHQLALIGVSIALSLVTWKFVEQPTRTSKLKDKKILVYALSLSLAFFVFGRIGKKTQGLEFLLPESTRVLFAFKTYDRAPLYREGVCFLRPEQSEKEFSEICKASGEPSIVLWGDSHAASLYFGLQTVYPGMAQYTASNCPPVLEIDVAARPHCKSINTSVLAKLSTTQPQTIILAANWLLYFDSFDEMALEKTLERLTHLKPQPKVLLVGGLPQWQPTLADAMHDNHQVLANNIQTPSRDLAKIRAADASLQSIAAKFSNVVWFEPTKIACSESRCNATASENGSLEIVAWDYAHLTRSGSLWWGQKIKQTASDQ